MARSGIQFGANAGHITTPIDRKAKRSNKKGKATKRTIMVRELVREVAGLAPYERRILDMIKTGGSSADKRIYKFAKRRLGSHKRALAKREQIKELNTKQRAKASAKDAKKPAAEAKK